MIKLNYDEAETKFISSYNRHVDSKKVKYKINADFLIFNCINAVECEREMMVSYFQMLPLLECCVKIDEADYILYAHPYARVEDMSSCVIKHLRHIDMVRKKYNREDIEIIVVGKATNVEEQLNGEISNITFYKSHFAETLGKRFEFEIKEEYFVYDSVTNFLNIWPVDGCLKKCKFCRRSYMNIPFESLPFERIKEELDYLKENDPKVLEEINLRAENLTEYGMDIYGEQRLADLINLISSYDEVKKISMRIGLAICEITDEILEAICNCKEKLDMISMNLEVGSNRLLSFIGKNHTRERAIHIYKEVRKSCPEAYMNTTVMVGFPTEQLEDIYQLADLINQADIDNILINKVGIAERCPLAKYSQLSENIRNYHLKTLLSLLKKQKRKRTLRVCYERIRKDGNRTKMKLDKEKQEYLENYSIMIMEKKYLFLK